MRGEVEAFERERASFQRDKEQFAEESKSFHDSKQAWEQEKSQSYLKWVPNSILSWA